MRYLGSGTNLADLMREGIERPTALVDFSGVACGIVETAGGGLEIGTRTRNAALAEELRVCTRVIRGWREPCWPAPRRRSATR